MANAITLSQAVISNWTKDEKFFQVMPEFNELKRQYSAAMAAQPAGGCSSCAKRRIVRSLLTTASKIFLRLNPAGLSRLKAYAGVDKIQYRGINPATNKYEVVIL